MTFAERLIKASDDCPNVPSAGNGRNTYICKQMGFNVTTVSRWFRGECEPGPSKMAKLAELLNVDIAWLTLGEPEFKDVKNLLKLSSADVFAFAAYLVEHGCSVGTDANNSSTLTAVCSGHVFHFQLFAGRINEQNTLELSPNSESRINDNIAIASIRRESATAVAEVHYQFLDIADVSIADKIIWCPESETFNCNGVNLLPLPGFLNDHTTD